mmetsp:Transcript_95598/g.274377  ORF Transcript_95598/g.274377 Transcript_95598/m.274377 type:complete len:308 (-) Transcript_95598:93-1016(-)
MLLQKLRAEALLQLLPQSLVGGKAALWADVLGAISYGRPTIFEPTCGRGASEVHDGLNKIHLLQQRVPPGAEDQPPFGPHLLETRSHRLQFSKFHGLNFDTQVGHVHLATLGVWRRQHALLIQSRVSRCRPRRLPVQEAASCARLVVPPLPIFRSIGMLRGLPGNRRLGRACDRSASAHERSTDPLLEELGVASHARHLASLLRRQIDAHEPQTCSAASARCRGLPLRVPCMVDQRQGAQVELQMRHHVLVNADCNNGRRCKQEQPRVHTSTATPGSQKRVCLSECAFGRPLAASFNASCGCRVRAS